MKLKTLKDLESGTIGGTPRSTVKTSDLKQAAIDWINFITNEKISPLHNRQRHHEAKIKFDGHFCFCENCEDNQVDYNWFAGKIWWIKYFFNIEDEGD